MTKSRPVQYLGLALLMLASLAVIFFPMGSKPQPQDYTVTLVAPKPWQELIGSTKKVHEAADAALIAAFKSEKLPRGTLSVVPGAAANGANANSANATGGTIATIEDTATTRGEAEIRAGKIADALARTFKGVKLAPQTQQEIADLPSAPMFTVGQYAVYPPKRENGAPVPAVKLGLDLQGGVNLVLQVRRALFTYTFDKKLGNDQDARDQFATQVRDALAHGPDELNLDEVDVNLSSDRAGVLEVRTQAKDRAQFEAQRKAILSTLQQQMRGVKFAEAREPQFYEPNESVGQQLGLNDTYSTQLLDRTVEIVRSRVDKLGVSEPQIQRQLPDRIIVQLPGVNDPQKAVEVIGKTAQMEIRLLPQDLTPVSDPADPNNTLFQDAQRNLVPSNVARERSELIVSGADVKPTSTVSYDESGEPAVHFELQGAGADKFGEVTARNIGRFMPIFLDERCISAPTIRSAITGGSGQISGGFKDMEEARALALLLNSGALPAPIDVVENRTVSATLGTDSLVKSLRAGIIGMIAVVIFMIAFYRLPGMLANFALIVYCILNLAVFILLGGTLTLPGIAGFLLAVAMSLDTNILVFERLKEEMSIQPTFAAALRAAFSRAWTAILDSHVTTLIASVVLFFLGTGPVKGFALTLGIGVLLSLFSAISVTRLFMWSVAHVGEKNRKLFADPVARAAGAAMQRS